MSKRETKAGKIPAFVRNSLFVVRTLPSRVAGLHKPERLEIVHKVFCLFFGDDCVFYFNTLIIVGVFSRVFGRFFIPSPISDFLGRIAQYDQDSINLKVTSIPTR